MLVIDKERPSLIRLTEILLELSPDSDIIPFRSYSEFMEYKSKSGFSAAFIDLDLSDNSGIELALTLKEHSPRCNIIFVSAHNELAADAFRARPSGFVKKPYTADDISAELDDLRYPPERDELFSRKLRVITFGSFLVYKADGTILHFRRSASRQIFAYLVDQCGYPVSVKDIAQDVFEDSEFSRQTSKNISKYIGFLMEDLEKEGYGDAVIRQNRTLQINKNRLNCDLYRALDGDVETLNSFNNEYMIDYSWAEMSESALRLRSMF